MPPIPPETVLRILHLENDSIDSELALGLLRSAGLKVEFLRVDTLADFKEALEQGSYALYLADYSVPGVNPMEALDLARQMHPEIPFVFLSGSMGEELAIETLKYGATDYVLKHRLERLAPAVRRALHEAEELSRLRKAEEIINRLAAIVESSPDAIYSETLEGQILSWNVGAVMMFGYSMEEIVGQSINRLVPMDCLHELEDIIRKITQGERIKQYETVFVGKTGERIQVSLTLSPIYNEAGQIIGTAAIARDISQRKQAEAALQEANEALRANQQLLESRVDQRTRQLRALAAKLTRAEENERRRVAHLLHEGLQQILVGAQYRLQSLMVRHRDAQIQQGLEEVSGILQESIRLSRSLTYELSPPILYLGDMAAILTWLSRWYQEKHGLTVKVEMEEPIEVTHEETRVTLFRSVLELLFNVVKHAQVKDARVHMSQTSEGMVQIEVIDQGIGFAPDQDRRLDETEAGFGLVHVRERLDQLGGRLEVHSTPGQGSHFTILVPGGQSLQPPMTETKPHLAFSQSLPTNSSKIRILLADDHSMVRHGLARVFNSEPDMEVVGQASDGLQAVSLTGQVQPDVIIMDISMPNMDGVEATRRISSEWPRIKVIGLSMQDDSAYRAAMQKAGAVDLLMKTRPPGDLLKAVRTYAGPKNQPHQTDREG